MDEVLAFVGRSVELAVRQASPSSTTSPDATATSTTTSATTTPSGGGGGNSTTSSPLLFFVALGFGVVFTNLWIIVGVKYCFRYNARNRARQAAGDGPDPIVLEAMPRPHRRRREKKLMSMDEVNERFPMTKYKNWVATRAREGLPTNGGVTAPPSRAGSIRETSENSPPSPTGTKRSMEQARRISTISGHAGSDIAILRCADRSDDEGRKSLSINTVENIHLSDNEKESSTLAPLQEVRTVDTTPDQKPGSQVEEEEDDDDDEHIQNAVPPELSHTPGDTCAICIDTLEDNDDIRGLTCGHAFHAGCLDPWLTSRRACCPLCKADYYTPKPRNGTETEEMSERHARRAAGRMNTPSQSQSAWNGLRGTPGARLVLPGRFVTTPIYTTDGYNQAQSSQPSRQSRRARTTQPEGLPSISTRPTWLARFRGVRFPTLHIPGRASSTDATAGSSTTEPTPGQLESGTRRWA